MSPPPAPASAPQTNCPVVASHSSFPAGSEQDVTSPAPYIEDRVVDPVTVSLDIVVVASEEVPVTDSDPAMFAFPVTPRLEEVALAKVVFPVTFSELALVVDRLVVPVAVRLPVVRFDVLALDRLV